MSRPANWHVRVGLPKNPPRSFPQSSQNNVNRIDIDQTTDRHLPDCEKPTAGHSMDKERRNAVAVRSSRNWRAFGHRYIRDIYMSVVALLRLDIKRDRVEIARPREENIDLFRTLQRPLPSNSQPGYCPFATGVWTRKQSSPATATVCTLAEAQPAVLRFSASGARHSFSVRKSRHTLKVGCTVEEDRGRHMRHQSKRSAETDPAVAVTPTEDSGRETPIRDEDIALLAYSYWEARAGRDGSAEEDWLRAERELRARAGQASRSAVAA